MPNKQFYKDQIKEMKKQKDHPQRREIIHYYKEQLKKYRKAYE